LAAESGVCLMQTTMFNVASSSRELIRCER
jgi:hypothetical protein